MKQLLFLLAFAGSLTLSAQTFDVGDIRYKVVDADLATVSVEKKTPSYTGAVVIPSKVTYEDAEYTVVSLTQSATASTTDGAFANCTGLTSVALPETLTAIGNYSFNGCTALTTITIPESVQNFGDGVFQNCSGLESIVMPKSAQKLGINLFKGCAKISQIAIPEGITDLPKYVLSSMNGLKEVTLPSTLVTIGDYNFYSCAALEMIEIPEGVSSVGQYFGAQSATVAKVVLPSTLTTIGKYSFWKSTAVTYLSCAAATPPAATNAFYAWDSVYPNCTLYVPQGSVEAYKNADVWKNFTNIEALLPPAAAIDTDFTVDGVSYIVKENTDRLAVTVLQLDDPENPDATYSGSVEIPETVKYQGRDYTVTAIGVGAFYSCKELKSVSMPASIENIGDYAFARCEALTTVGTLPVNLAKIGPKAFIYTPELSGISVAEGNTHFAVDQDILYALDDNGGKESVVICAAKTTGDKTIAEGVTTIEYAAFAKCEQVSGIAMPSTLTTIGEYAFDGCTRIYQLTIPDNVTSIGAQAFYQCNYMTDLKLPANLQSVEEGTFMFCRSLTSLDLPASVASIGKYAFEGCTGLTEMVLPESCAFLGDHAFEECKGLTSVTIPSAMRTIDDFAFLNCANLASLSLPKEMDRIGYGAFKDCGGLETIVLPETLGNLDGYAFGNCVKLTSIAIPRGITIIADRLFWGCTALADISIPTTVTEIGPFAFDRTPIKEMILHEGVTTIGEDAFQHCKQLEVISLPKSMTYIDKYAFWDCTSARVFTSLAEEPAFAEKAFSSGFPTATCVLYVPASAVEDYKAAEGWKRFANIVAIPGVGNVFTVEGVTYKVTAIAEDNNTVEVVKGETDYTGDVMVPAEVSNYYDYVVTAIGNMAFADCASLESITLPATLETIGEKAFKDCTGLKTITCLGETPAAVEADAFEGVDQEKVNLIVPENASEAYSNAEVWKEFFKDSGIEEINVNGANKLVIYDIMGRIAGNSAAELTPGVYIVNGRKVVVK